jgi:hypothetical protein
VQLIAKNVLDKITIADGFVKNSLVQKTQASQIAAA